MLLASSIPPIVKITTVCWTLKISRTASVFITLNIWQDAPGFAKYMMRHNTVQLSNSIPNKHLSTCHFSSLISELKSIGKNFNISGSLQFVTTICGDVESNMVTFQQRHLWLCIFISKWKFFRNHKVNLYASRQWIILITVQKIIQIRNFKNSVTLSTLNEKLSNSLLSLTILEER